MWLFVSNQHCFGYIEITTLNNKNTFGAPYTFCLTFEDFCLGLTISHAPRDLKRFGREEK